MNPNATYRVVLSHDDICYLVTMCRANPSPEHKAILKRIGPMHARITDGMATPMNIETVKQSKAAQLGLEEPKGIDYSKLRHECYLKWKIDPDSLGVEERIQADIFRHANDLMDPAEKDAYEDAQFTLKL